MTQDLDTGRAVFPSGDTARAYADPSDTITAHRIAEVRPALAALERQVASGKHVAGFLAYEAAGAFDPALQTHAAGDLPLLWFGVYDAPLTLPAPQPAAPPCPALTWRPQLDRGAYCEALAEIRRRIAAGDTYQVNFTFPLEAEFTSPPETWFWERLAAQESPYGAFLDLGRHKVMSLSPELFFELDGEHLTTRPMKGTRPRGLSSTSDRALAEALARSPKDRAENLMIVDMIRNDLGRVCAVNSIQVPELFSVERYPTVWQMTSTVTGRSQADVPEILAALFPSASVTGAPKIETMKIIRRLEPAPRGVYCGAIGWWAPGRRARFNVAIRTATLDTATGLARYPAGSGITWDSDPSEEYAECLQKAAVLQATHPSFSIISALRLESSGYFLLEMHLDRMLASAEYFGYPVDREKLRTSLEGYAGSVGERPAKVRVALDRSGALALRHETLPPPGPFTAGLALTPSDSMQPWTHHKTTHRAVYGDAQATRPDCDIAVLWTRDGRLTEATTANIVLRIGDRRYTPPTEDGLLAGIYRRHLLEHGEIEERSLTLDDLEAADEILLINSVRKWIPVRWVPHAEAPRSLQDIR